MVTKNQLNILNNSRLLKSKSLKNNIHSYLLGSDHFDSLKEILSQIEGNENIISYQLNE